MISLPARTRQRLGRQMADPTPPLLRSLPRRGMPWSRERIAQELVPFRDRLVARLTAEISAARDLSRDQCELVIDDAIDYMVTQHAKPLTCDEELDRAFWAAASFRVKRMHEGRGATVRAGYQRVDVEALELTAAVGDPESAAVERDDELILLEFVVMLTDGERDVFACKYGSSAKVLGRNLVSRRLGLPMGQVRRAEREITRKLERFVTLMSAGALCSYRWDAISSLAASAATPDEAAAARVHLERCPSCRAVYTTHVRALRSGELPRKIAGLLPLPPVASAAHDRGVRSLFADWVTRPFTGDHVATATQLAGSGLGRGGGTLLTAKLVALCLSGAAVSGGAACVTLGVLDGSDVPPRRGAPLSSAQTASPEPTATPTPREVKPSRTAAPSNAQAAKPPSSRGSTSARSHEQRPASPAPSGSLPAGGSEFSPTAPAGSAPSAAAPSTGMPEFP